MGRQIILQHKLSSPLFAVVLLLLCPVYLIGQDDDEVIRTTTNLVVINVSVTDQTGQYIKKLKSADFKIFEDGVEVPTGAITSFEFQEAPYAAVILLDSSGSMETRFSLARSGAIRFLDGLRPEDTVAVYKFDTKVERVQDFSYEKDLAPTAYSIRAKGYTTLNDAVVKAAEVLAQRPEQRRAIIILSDGMDTYSKASSDKALDSALNIGASIYAVDMSALDTPGHSNKQSAMQLKGWADKTGGRLVTTPGGPALRDAFASIAAELGQQYTISYKPANPVPGQWKALEVKVSREGALVRSRKGYKLPKR